MNEYNISTVHILRLFTLYKYMCLTYQAQYKVTNMTTIL